MLTISIFRECKANLFKMLLSRNRLFSTPWAIDLQAPLSMVSSRQEHWSGLPFPPPGDLPYPGIEPRSAALQADSLPFEPPGKPSLCKAITNIWLTLVLYV